MAKWNSFSWLLVVAWLLSSCGAEPVVAPAPVEAVEAPAPATQAFELDVVIVPAPPECGAEAAITLAQTQSDLALAAVADVEQVEAVSGDAMHVAAIGQAAFDAARELMAGYQVPGCLEPARTHAVQFFTERKAGYEALAAGDTVQFEQHLAQGEAARQAMVAVINEMLAQP